MEGSYATGIATLFLDCSVGCIHAIQIQIRISTDFVSLLCSFVGTPLIFKIISVQAQMILKIEGL